MHAPNCSDGRDQRGGSDHGEVAHLTLLARGRSRPCPCGHRTWAAATPLLLVGEVLAQRRGGAVLEGTRCRRALKNAAQGKCGWFMCAGRGRPMPGAGANSSQGDRGPERAAQMRTACVEKAPADVSGT